MAYYEITANKVRENIKARIAENQAELDALKGVTIDTKQKTLSNRAISGKGTIIGDYIGLGKALYINYTIDKPKDGGSYTSYTKRDITAYSYYNPDGSEIGTNGCMRISRTITPAELNDILTDVKDGLASTIGNLQSEYRRATSIAKKHNALVAKINEYNDGLSYASDAKI